MPEEIQHRDLERIAAAREKKHRRLLRWMQTAPDVPFVRIPCHPRNRADHPMYAGLYRLTDEEVEANRLADIEKNL